MAETDIDTLAPWSIKAISLRVRDEIAAEARRSDVTTGALIERMWAVWKANGSPVQMPAPPPSDALSDLRRVLEVIGPFGAGNPMPGKLRSLVNGLAGDLIARRPAHGTPPGRIVSVEARKGNGVARISNGERG